MAKTNIALAVALARDLQEQSLSIFDEEFTKKITTKLNSNKIRMNIENKINYKNEVIVGLLEILLINKNILLDYQIHKN